MVRERLKPIALLGAGSWGTALALYLSRQGQTVRIWSVEESEITAMLAEKVNNRYLPGFSLPDTLHPVVNLAEAVNDVEDVMMVVPSVGFRQTLTLLKRTLTHPIRIISATKGIDEETGQMLNEVVEEIFGKEQKFAVLSGPSFAREVAAGLPCAVDMASLDQPFLNDLMQRFNSDIFSVHPTSDIIGVEIGGIVKNVIAIATGIADGMQLGANLRSALITWGMAEIIRLASALSAKKDTLIGLSGMGDLILTCSDDLSRNRRLGLALGKGLRLSEAEREIGQAIEGRRNAQLIVKLAESRGVIMPICKAVQEILNGNLSPKEAIAQIFSTIPA